MSTTPTRMPDYNPAGRRRFKQLRDRSDTTPRIGQIMGIKGDELLDALGRVVCSGCAVLFSPTSDGGAMSITVYYGDDRARDYVSSAEEFAAALVLVSDLAEAHAYGGSTNGPKASQRGSESVTK